jgi:hypothetical protein
MEHEKPVKYTHEIYLETFPVEEKYPPTKTFDSIIFLKVRVKFSSCHRM